MAADVPQWSSDGVAGFVGTTKVSTGLEDWLLRMFNDTPLASEHGQLNSDLVSFITQ